VIPCYEEEVMNTAHVLFLDKDPLMSFLLKQLLVLKERKKKKKEGKKDDERSLLLY
jgi:hypothetical protein